MSVRLLHFFGCICCFMKWIGAPCLKHSAIEMISTEIRKINI